MADKNPITGDLLQSRMNSKEFEENFDRIFRQRINEQKLSNDDMLPKYELDDGQITDEQYAKIKELAEYELNPSTGEVQKVNNGNKPNSVKP
jgi:acyl-homoserine lactone acylase PvdQ